MPKVAVVGAGGYAKSICQLLLRHPEELNLVAVCEPDAAKREEAEAFLGDGVSMYDDIGTMLAALPAEVRGVWLPVPIHLHVPFTRKVLESGRAVMCEKPPAGTVQEVDELSAMADEFRERVGVAEPVLIGYQHHYLPSTLQLKQHLLAGDIGEVRAMSVLAPWVRGNSYYGRNNWAGALQREGRWVLDSPANNALAHMVNLATYFLGTTEAEPAVVRRVEAELYRVNPIENFDTCGIRVTTDAGRQALILMTHACRVHDGPWLAFHGSAGQATWKHPGGIEVRPDGGESTQIDFHFGDRLPMLRGWRAVLENRPLAAPAGEWGVLATLRAVRAQTVVVNATAEAAMVHDIPAEFVETIDREGDTVRVILGIEQDFARCAAELKLPHELGIAWTKPAGVLDVPPDYRFTAPAGA